MKIYKFKNTTLAILFSLSSISFAKGIDYTGSQRTITDAGLSVGSQENVSENRSKSESSSIDQMIHGQLLSQQENDQNFNVNDYVNDKQKITKSHNVNIDKEYVHGIDKHAILSHKDKDEIIVASETSFGVIEINAGYITYPEADLKFTTSQNTKTLVTNYFTKNSLDASILNDLQDKESSLTGLKSFVKNGWFLNAKTQIDLHDNFGIVVGVGIDALNINYENINELSNKIKDSENLKALKEKLSKATSNQVGVDKIMSGITQSIDNTFTSMSDNFKKTRKDPYLYKLNGTFGIRAKAEFNKTFNVFGGAGAMVHTYFDPLLNIKMGSEDPTVKDHLSWYIEIGANVTFKESVRIGAYFSKEFYNLRACPIDSLSSLLSANGYEKSRFEAENLNPMKFGLSIGLDF